MIHYSRLFFYLTLLLLPTQLGYHFWPSWALVLGRQVDYLAPTVFVTDITILFTLLFWGLARLNIKNGIQNHEIKLNLQPTFQNSLFIIFGSIYILINIYLSLDPFITIAKWLKLVEFGFLGIYIIRTNVRPSEVIFPLSISVMYSSILALLQFALQHSIGGYLWWFGERTFSLLTPGIAKLDFCILGSSCREILRSYATFPHPNVLGGFLITILPMIIFQLNTNQRLNISHFQKIFFLLTALFGCIALLLTFSRGAWTAAGVGLLNVGINRYFIKSSGIKIRSVFSFIGVGLGILFIIYSSVAMIHGASLFFPQRESLYVRDELNQSALMMWHSSPLYGVGLGNFLTVLPSFLVAHTVYFLQPVHNIYLLILAELGMVGVALSIIVITKVLKYEFGIIHHVPSKRSAVSYTFIIRNSLFMILFLGLIDHYPITLQQGQLLTTLFIALNLSDLGTVR